MVEYKKPFINLLWKANREHLRGVPIADTIVIENRQVEGWFKYSKFLQKRNELHEIIIGGVEPRSSKF